MYLLNSHSKINQEHKERIIYELSSNHILTLTFVKIWKKSITGGKWDASWISIFKYSCNVCARCLRPSFISSLNCSVSYGEEKKKVNHVINRTFHQHFENVQSQPYSLGISRPRINLDRGQFWQRADICQFFWQLPINTQKSLWGCYCQIIWIQWWVKDQKPIDKAEV